MGIAELRREYSSASLTEREVDADPIGQFEKWLVQALSAEYAIQHAAELERKVYPVPPEIDAEIARLKLETMEIAIDQLTEEQAKYLASWDEGT